PESVSLIVPASSIDSAFAGTIGEQRIPVPFRRGSGDTTVVSLESFWEVVPNEDGLRIEVVYRNTASFEFREDALWTLDPVLTGGWFPYAPGSFTSDITISVPSGWTAVTAGEPAAQRRGADDREVYLYRSSTRLPARSILLAAGAFDRTSDGVSAGGRRVDVTTLHPPGSEHAGPGNSFAAYFSEPGITYPLIRYTEVVVPTDEVITGAGMALVALEGQVGKELIRTSLSAASWEDFWIEEALPGYLAAKDDPSLLLDLRNAYLAEAEEYVRPLVWNRWHHPMQLRDAHTLARGVWVLHVINRQIGDEAFHEVLGLLLGPDKFAELSTAGLYEAVRQATGEDHESFLDQWIRSAEHPVLTVDYRKEGEHLVLGIRQEQHGEFIPEAFRLDLTIEVGTLAGTERFDVAVNERSQEILIPMAAAPRFIVVDPEMDFLLETRVDQPVSAWVAQLRYASTPAGRIHAARALRGDSGDPALLIAFRSALEQETRADVRAAIVRKLAEFPHSEAAERALLGSFEDDSPVVRVAVLQSLWTYKTPQAEALALRAAESDTVHEVQAAAVRTLGALQAGSAPAVVRAALITPSSGDVIRIAALDALADRPGLAPADALKAGLEYSGGEYPMATRRAAARLLSTLASSNRNAMSRLVELLTDGPLPLRIAAAEQLAGLGAWNVLEDRLAAEPVEYARHRLRTLVLCR
ncbi:MAG: HEAT repeat domain-containing protein, partial [Rhodothermales bacterium]